MQVNRDLFFLKEIDRSKLKEILETVHDSYAERREVIDFVRQQDLVRNNNYSNSAKLGSYIGLAAGAVAGFCGFIYPILQDSSNFESRLVPNCIAAISLTGMAAFAGSGIAFFNRAYEEFSVKRYYNSVRKDALNNISMKGGKEK